MNNEIVFIGDVHGKYNKYHKIISNYPKTIQLGDMGVGFKRTNPSGKNEYYPNPSFDKMSKGNHRFIRGNHDNPHVCKYQKYWIQDGYVEDNMMFVGGACSVDRAWRTEGYDWWSEEELTHKELWEIQTIYNEHKPEIMVTHDAPEFLVNYLIAASGRTSKISFPSVTRQAFDGYFYNHKPKLWLFGHWHIPFDLEYKGCRFICLPELACAKVNTKTLEVEFLER